MEVWQGGRDSPAQVGLQQWNSGTLVVSRVNLRAKSPLFTVSRVDVRRESGFQEVLGRGRNPCRKPTEMVCSHP